MPPKQPSGAQKCRKRKLDEQMTKSQSGALYKYMHKPSVEERVEEQAHVEEEVHIELEQEEAGKHEHVEEKEHVEVKQEETVEHNHIFDPRRWEGLNADEIKLLVEKGPKRDYNIGFGPRGIFFKLVPST